jgi:hypothetical protein
MAIVQPNAPQDSSQLPAQGIAPGAGAPSILAGLPGQQQPAPEQGALEQMVSGYLKHITTIADQSDLTKKTNAQVAASQAAANKPVVEGQPAAAPRPGSFGDKLSSAVNAWGSDAAHATDRPGGWLSGIANTLNAREMRMAQEQKDQALLAKTQAETVMLHRNAYLQELPIREGMYKANEDYVGTKRLNHDVTEDITHDELMKRSKEKDFAAKYLVRATGEEPVLGADGMPTKDKNGIPVTIPKYAIITRATKDGQPDNHTLTADNAAEMKKYLGSGLPANTTLTGPQWDALNVQLVNARNAVNTLENGNEKPLSEGQMKSISPYLNDPTIQSAIAHVPGSPYAGIKEYQKNADDQIDAFQQLADRAKEQKDQGTYDQATAKISEIRQEQSKVAQFAASGAIDPKQIAAYDKKNEEQVGWIDKMLHDPNEMAGEKSVTALSQLQTALDSATDPKVRVKLTQAIATAKNAHQAYRDDLEAKAKADQMAKQGDPKEAGRLLAGGLLTLDDLKTRGTTAQFIQQATDAAVAIDKDYNPADEKNFEHVAKSATMARFFGASRSMMEKGGTTDIVYNLGQRIPDNGMPVLNKLEDWAKLAAGKGPLSGYASSILGLADDYSKVMGGGNATDSARDHALSLMGAALTKAQRLESLQALLADVGSQQHGMIGKNRFMQREYNDFERSNLTPKITPPEAPAAGQGQATIAQPKAAAAKPTGKKVGEKFTQGGNEYTITSVDKNGNVTGAE